MNDIWVYDFDGTIYNGDSSIDFFIFCLRKKISLIRCLPRLIFNTFLYGIKKINAKEYKERFFSYLKYVPNIDYIVEQFWEEKKDNIKLFFIDDLKENNRPKICIISASPKFLLEGYTKNLKNVSLIATEMNKKNGVIIGENCKGKEKVKKFNKKYKNYVIMKFYSDSKSDEYLSKIARESFMVKKNKIYKW